jgi:hypothetical protein
MNEGHDRKHEVMGRTSTPRGCYVFASALDKRGNGRQHFLLAQLQRKEERENTEGAMGVCAFSVRALCAPTPCPFTLAPNLP